MGTLEEHGMVDISNWSSVIRDLCAQKSLTIDESFNLMQQILLGSVPDIQLAGFLIALASKGESTDEIIGFSNALLEVAEKVEVPTSAVDIVGTGGSTHGKLHALNVSTMASFVVAAAGVPVCKHGNRKASSTSGSFDFLEALGVEIERSPEQVTRSVEQLNLGFIYAKSFHPAMKHVGAVRKSLGVPTVFNLLGPLVHPARVKRMVLGTPSKEKAEKMAGVLSQRGVDKAWVVSGEDGLDELTLSGESTVFEITDKSIKTFVVNPAEVGMKIVDSKKIPGGSAAENAEIFSAIIRNGEKGAHTDIVVLNAAAGLVVAGKVVSLSEGVRIVEEVISSGRVAQLVDKYILFSQQR